MCQYLPISDDSDAVMAPKWIIWNNQDYISKLYSRRGHSQGHWGGVIGPDTGARFQSKSKNGGSSRRGYIRESKVCSLIRNGKCKLHGVFLLISSCHYTRALFFEG